MLLLSCRRADKAQRKRSCSKALWKRTPTPSSGAGNEHPRSFNRKQLECAQDSLCAGDTPLRSSIKIFSRVSLTLMPTTLRAGRLWTQELDQPQNKGGSQRSLSLFVLVGVLLLEVRGDRLHDLLCLGLVVNGVSVEVLGRT